MYTYLVEVAGARMGSSAHLGIFYTCNLKCYTQTDTNTDLTVLGVIKVCSDIGNLYAGVSQMDLTQKLEGAGRQNFTGF